MNGTDLRHRLGLDHHATFDQRVDSKRVVELDAIILKGHEDFATDGEPAFP